MKSPLNHPTLVIMAAGMASRYGSLKQIEALGPQGQTLLDYSVRFALEAGFGHIIFIIRKSIEKDFETAILSRYQGRVSVSCAFQEVSDLPAGLKAPAERTKPWGTVQAVLAAKDQLKGPFAVLNADDFYGKKAFEAAADHLRLLTDDNAIVGYPVERTLSAHGAVTRAVCEKDAQDYLTDITELQSIQIQDGRITSLNEDGTQTPLPAGLTVSMNFWAFSPRILPLLESEFVQFLQRNLDQAKAELPLPTAIKSLVQAQAARVKVLRADSPWFGVTYPEDKAEVVRQLAELNL